MKRKEKKKKIYQINTRVGIDTTLKEIDRVMENLKILKEDYRTVLDSYDGKAGLLVKQKDVHYVIVSEEQKNLKNNIRVVYQLIHSRELNIRKGAETIETAFGGYVDWLGTPRLPAKAEKALRQRGVVGLPEPEISQLDVKDEDDRSIFIPKEEPT